MVPLLKIDDQMLAMLWPLMRVSGVILMAPIFGSAYVPIRIRALIAIVLTFVVAPFAQAIPNVGLLSIDFFLVMMREVAIGLAIGFVLRLVIDAAVIGGQVLATSMGLHFATVVDPNQGGTPTLGQFYVIIASLLLIVTNTHLALIELLADSFKALPLTTAQLSPEAAWLVVQFGGTMLVNGLQLALPSIAAILMVNVAFGVVSRAAPSLNLFAVGFPIAMLVGFIVTIFTVQQLLPIWLQAVEAAFATMLQLSGGP